MNAYFEEVMEKLTDLQQQTHFCVNNYEYYHKNNEMEILRHKEKQLRTSSNHLTGFLNAMGALQNTIEEAASKCDEVDELLAKCSSTESQKVEEEDTDSNKENI